MTKIDTSKEAIRNGWLPIETLPIEATDFDVLTETGRRIACERVHHGKPAYSHSFPQVETILMSARYWRPCRSDMYEALSRQHALTERALNAAKLRAEKAEAERDELDFLLNEGHPDSLPVALARAEARVAALEGALIDARDTLGRNQTEDDDAYWAWFNRNEGVFSSIPQPATVNDPLQVGAVKESLTTAAAEVVRLFDDVDWRLYPRRHATINHNGEHFRVFIERLDRAAAKWVDSPQSNPIPPDQIRSALADLDITQRGEG